MNQNDASQDKLVGKIGFWSAVLSTFLVAITTVASAIGVMGYYDTSLLQYTLWLVLAPTVVVLMLSIHNSSISSNKKILSGSGFAFILIYAVIISFNYFIQLTTMRLAPIYGTIAGMELFGLSTINIYTIAWSLEVLGYGFQGLALLFIAPLFHGSRIKSVIRWLLVINGLNGVFGLIVFPLNLNLLMFVSSFFLWSALFPVTTAVLSLYFRRISIST